MEQKLFERILAELAKGNYSEEIKRARDVFFERIKDLCEDDPSYERLTGCFLDWYVFDRPMESGRGTPLQIFSAGDERTDEELALLAAMAANIHSLYEILRIEEQAIGLKDLFTTESIWVTERRTLAGLDPGDILEARLIPLGDKLVFSTGAYVLHPRLARPLILQAVDRSRKKGAPPAEQLIRRLQALSFRYSDRYQQRVPIEKVYSEIASFTG